MGLVKENSNSSVWKYKRSMPRNDPEMLLAPDEWSGYGGVAMNDTHVGSPTVLGLPSLSPSRIAVIGRQKF